MYFDIFFPITALRPLMRAMFLPHFPRARDVEHEERRRSVTLHLQLSQLKALEEASATRPACCIAVHRRVSPACRDANDRDTKCARSRQGAACALGAQFVVRLAAQVSRCAARPHRKRCEVALVVPERVDRRGHAEYWAPDLSVEVPGSNTLFE
jgi:hypothetical protein